MIFIDLEHKRPTDKDIPGWKPWTQKRWQAWLDKSKQLVDDMAKLEEADKDGKHTARNALIDANSAHWGKLKPWLQALSGGKCWFSEVRELYSHYDVEHFRPKKEAKALDGGQRDGYWWLAFDYMNFRVCGNVGNRKKGGWFPLRQGSPCSSYAGLDRDLESPYLLDPIKDADVALLAFDEEGKAVPAPGTSPWERERVSETVKRLKLNEHAPLAEARRKVWQKVDGLIADYATAKASSADGNNPVARDRLDRACRDLRHLTRHTEELSAVARWCVLLRNDPHLSRLLA